MKQSTQLLAAASLLAVAYASNRNRTPSGKPQAAQQAPGSMEPITAPIRGINGKKWLSRTESIKLLKKTLRKEFPGVKFSVRGDRGTAYGWANIKWTDGPTEAMVKSIASPFATQGFDGMTDSTYSTGNTLYAQVDKDGGLEEVASGISQFSLHRDYSIGDGGRMLFYDQVLPPTGPMPSFDEAIRKGIKRTARFGQSGWSVKEERGLYEACIDWVDRYQADRLIEALQGLGAQVYRNPFGENDKVGFCIDVVPAGVSPTVPGVTGHRIGNPIAVAMLAAPFMAKLAEKAF